jgi:hypothetical protein
MSDSHWIDSLVTRLPHVRPSFVEDVKNMSREELQRRVLIGSDWQGAFACSLDGIPEISCMPGGGIDGCRTHKEVRAVVTQLIKECPKTWAKTWAGQIKPECTSA